MAMWGMSLFACVAVGLLLVVLFRQSTEARIGRAEAVVAHACDLIRDRYGFYAAGWKGSGVDETLRRDLAVAVGLALGRQDGVEGGVWQAAAGPLAYAFPTYEGTGPKTDLPVAELQQIQAVNLQAARDEQPVARHIASGAQTLLLESCPLPGPLEGLTGWTMTRVRAVEGFQPLQLGLGVLLALMVAMSGWLGHMLLAWRRHVRAIEAALGSVGLTDRMPVVARTGERELDQIIDALNEAGCRLGQARQEADSMAARAARAERLAGLGRVAAGMAHEIRNPIAAARLQGENALAGDDDRRRRAIGDMLAQIDRLDALVSELLAMTQRVEPIPVPVDLDAFLSATLDRHRDMATAKSITLTAHGGGAGVLDTSVVGRILDNLIGNAIRHAPARGVVTLTAEPAQRLLRLTVADDGPGIAADVAGQLFEPFMTTRADGTGLGLAIARELADAHGGRLLLHDRQPGATFVLELPQP